MTTLGTTLADLRSLTMLAYFLGWLCLDWLCFEQL